MKARLPSPPRESKATRVHQAVDTTSVEPERPATTRRHLLRQAAALGTGALFGTLGHHGVWAAGSDAPEKKEVKIGFIPLTDCASVVMASVLGFDQKYGVKFVLSKEASWAGVRDKLVNGDLDMAHVLYGLIYGVHLGVGGPRRSMAILMTLNQ
ncbi:MAG: ABC transporter substrate-binding protein, partial [Tepidimonas sp.]|nr:ABC transporter substrate-binding protein [Tepidimonas sp.]